MTRRQALLGVIPVAAGVAGIGISIYLTVVHYSGLPLVCSATGAIDCERVLTSGYAVIAGSGVPTSVAGIAWFAVSTVIAAAQIAVRSRGLARAQLAWSAIGLAAALYLVFLEIVELGAICIWCTAAHALVLLTFLAVLTGSGRLAQTSPD